MLLISQQRMDYLNRMLGREMDTSSDELTTSGSRGHQQMPSAMNTVRGRSLGPSRTARASDTTEASESANLKSQLSRTEMELSRLRAKHKNLSHLHREANKKHGDLAILTKQLTQELDSLNLHVRSLQQELHACKDDLFKMQPTNKVPDSHIARAYDDLQEHVCSWIASEISHFEENFRQANRGSQPEIFHHGGGTDVECFLTAHPITGGEYLVRCYIFAMLQEMIFSKNDLLFGLSDEETALFHRIERSMGKAKPPKGIDCHLLRI